MSDNIPFEIQLEIIKKVSHVKSLLQFRSVSKPWKSFIDSSDFIKGYGARHTQPHSRILSYRYDSILRESKYVCLVEDDDIETSKVKQQQEFAVSPLLKQYPSSFLIGSCHGLLCFFCYDEWYKKRLVIWNPSIRKSFGIVVPRINNLKDYGFGVCPVTKDPTVVKIKHSGGIPWRVEVFTLSSGVWNVIPSVNLPRQSIVLDKPTQVVIDRFIYWGAWEKTFNAHFVRYMVVSFDLITKEFKVVDLPVKLAYQLSLCHVSVSKLRGSLVVCAHTMVEETRDCGVWVMERDSSFRKLYNIGRPCYPILGFRKNIEPIFEIGKADGQFATLNVYDPCSQQIKNLVISGVAQSFFMGSYKESLLLLDHSDLHIYSDGDSYDDS